MSISSVRISIIVPSFNQGKYIENTILSVLNQEYSEWELIIQDNESTDQTSDVCEKYVARDSRIRFYREKDNGFADAVNKALRRCHGTFIGIQSSDDYYACSTVFSEVSYLKKRHPNLSLISGQAIPININHVQIAYEATGNKNGFLEAHTTFTLENHFSQGSSFFCKERALEIGGFETDLDIVADTDFWVRFCNYKPTLELNSIYRSDQIWGCVTVHPQQRSANLSHFFLGRAKMGINHYKNPNFPYSDTVKLKQSIKLIFSAIEYYNSIGKNSSELFILYKKLTGNNISIKKRVKSYLSHSALLRMILYSSKINDSFHEIMKDKNIDYPVKWF